MSSNNSNTTHYILTSYNWAGLGKSRVAVIGQFSSQIRDVLSTYFPRLRVAAYDSTQSLPDSKVDVYLLNSVISGLDTTSACEALQSTVTAMNKSRRRNPARLLIVDTLQSASPRSASLDVSSTKRDVEEWTEILRSVQPRLLMTSLRQPEGSPFALVEAVIDEEVEDTVFNEEGESLPAVFMRKSERNERPVNISITEVLPDIAVM